MSVHAIVGLRGTGKTAVLSQALQSYDAPAKKVFKGGLFWLDATSVISLKNDIVKHLGEFFKRPDLADPDMACNALVRWLNHQCVGRCLVVLDNLSADVDSIVQEFLGRLLEHCAVTVVITSSIRPHILDFKGVPLSCGPVHLVMGRMPTSITAKLLYQYQQSSQDKVFATAALESPPAGLVEAYTKLAETVDGLPTMLDLVGRKLQREDPARLVRRLNNRPEELTQEMVQDYTLNDGGWARLKDWLKENGLEELTQEEYIVQLRQQYAFSVATLVQRTDLCLDLPHQLRGLEPKLREACRREKMAMQRQKFGAARLVHQPTVRPLSPWLRMYLLGAPPCVINALRVLACFTVPYIPKVAQELARKKFANSSDEELKYDQWMTDLENVYILTVRSPFSQR